MFKVREVITLKGWTDGSGYSFTQTYSDSIIDVTDIESIDWDWYETGEDNPEDSGCDTEIIVKYYAEDADITEDEPLTTHKTWESDLWKERNE